MIRKATSNDIPSLIPLLQQLFTIEEDFSFDPEKQGRGLALLLQTNSGTILVAEKDKSIVGMVTGQLVVSTAEGRMALLIEDLVVRLSHQGQGIGPALLQGVADWGRLQGAHRMQLLSDLENSKALEFYKKQAWKRTQLLCLRKYHQDLP